MPLLACSACIKLSTSSSSDFVKLSINFSSGGLDSGISSYSDEGTSPSNDGSGWCDGGILGGGLDSGTS